LVIYKKKVYRWIGGHVLNVSPANFSDQLFEGTLAITTGKFWYFKPG